MYRPLQLIPAPFQKNGKYQNFRQSQRQNFFSCPSVSTGAAAKIPQFIEQWKSITSDPAVLEIVTGVNIPFQKSPQVTKTVPELHPLLEQEAQNLLEKGAIYEVPFCEDGFYSRLFVTPKRDGSMRPIIDLSPLSRHTAFSNGELGYSKVSSQARSLHDQDRSQGRILFGTYSPSESEIPEIPVAKQSIQVLFSSIRSEHCTVSVYSPHETNCRFPEETGRSPTPVPGRYAHNWFDPSRSQRLHPDGCESPKSVGVHNQPGQIGSNPNSGYNVSRVYNQFNNDAFHSALRSRKCRNY